ncbi:MAG TPA: kelch repeat-containing protein, partial [Thermoplasmata archaeon]|nr:kelch repeat-containing protein [Thermoplasmata archaeon]
MSRALLLSLVMVSTAIMGPLGVGFGEVDGSVIASGSASVGTVSPAGSVAVPRGSPMASLSAPLLQLPSVETRALPVADPTTPGTTGQAPGNSLLAIPGAPFNTVQDAFAVTGSKSPSGASLASWSRMKQGPFPEEGYLTGLVFDKELGQFVTVGGYTGSAFTNRTWTFDEASNTWTNVSTKNGPPALVYHTLVYDSRAKASVIFTGAIFPPGAFFNYTYLYNSSSRSFINASGPGAPPTRYVPTMAFDEGAGVSVLYGGVGLATGAPMADTWLFDGVSKTWSNVTKPTNPGLRYAHHMAYHPGIKKVVLYGGYYNNSYYFADTWLFDTSTRNWTNASAIGTPGNLAGGAMTYDPSSGLIIYTGGTPRAGAPNTLVYVYDASTNQWSKADTKWNPPSSIFPTMAALDPMPGSPALGHSSGGKVVYYGGSGG